MTSLARGSFMLLFRWCSSSIEEVLDFACLDGSEILSSTFKTFYFRSLRLNCERIICLYCCLGLDQVRPSSVKVYGHTLSISGSCEKFPQLFVINNPKISCMCPCLLSIYICWIFQLVSPYFC